MSFAPVTAIAVFYGAVFCFAHYYAVVTPFPYKATAETWRTVEDFVIIFKVSRTVSHSVAVFAKYKRTFFFFVQRELAPVCRRRIHTRNNIVRLVGSVALIMNTFVMQKACIVKTLNPLGGFCKIMSVTAFVSHGPHNYTWTVDVTCNTDFFAVKNALVKKRITCRKSNAGIVRPVPVGSAIYANSAVHFKVCFVYYIKSVAVAELVKNRSIRVMRSSDCIYIVLLHKPQVIFKLGHTCSIACVGVAVVSV